MHDESVSGLCLSVRDKERIITCCPPTSGGSSFAAFLHDVAEQATREVHRSGVDSREADGLAAFSYPEKRREAWLRVSDPVHQLYSTRWEAVSAGNSSLLVDELRRKGLDFLPVSNPHALLIRKLGEGGEGETEAEFERLLSEVKHTRV